ncbi:hypothetical protein HCH_06872 [Hahella chejuensis KCTC 2396]|uniref:Uncharacterized protein n=1 Tax=Hahella chejuensis (strain KCTC 2396) TaxID=349521 RepID=Q2S784_HAHCH|nr:hypothetical protein HCH_06872 [Hahella chejuensis KCTC 2396]
MGFLALFCGLAIKRINNSFDAALRQEYSLPFRPRF